MRIQDSIIIERPVEDVFAYVSNVNHLPEWAGTTIEVKDAPAGPLRDGATFADVGKFLGRRIDTPFRATVEAPHRLVYRSTGGLVPHDWTYTFEPLEDSTRMTLAVEGEPGGFFRLATPLLERALRRQMSKDLASLKRVIESRS
jgi:uncharacterized protein YndB with AHSA1/START domain